MQGAIVTRTTFQAENVRLIVLLESHGIEWRAPNSAVFAARESEPSRLSNAEKLALFRRRFRGHTDEYPNRLLIPLSGAVIYDHLASEHTVAVYPLLEDDELS